MKLDLTIESRILFRHFWVLKCQSISFFTLYLSSLFTNHALNAQERVKPVAQIKVSETLWFLIEFYIT